MGDTLEDLLNGTFNARYEHRPLTAAQSTLVAIARIRRMAKAEKDRAQQTTGCAQADKAL